MKRKIIEIDEEKCTGCGLCIPGCAEGALAIVDGKARIVRDMFCDGLGACLGHCPEGALRIIEREAEEFDEEAALEHVRKTRNMEDAPAKPAGCPSAAILRMAPTPLAAAPGETGSSLSHWPIKIRLVPPHAPFLDNADLIIAGDCCPAASPDFHSRFLDGRVLMLGCPKFDNAEEYVERLAQMFAQARIRSITVLEMEVPCCSGMSRIVARALDRSGKDIPCTRRILGRDGRSVEEKMPLSVLPGLVSPGLAHFHGGKM